MDNGIYVRRELKIITYERGVSDDVFVVVINDTDPDHPIVIHGDPARTLVMTLLDQLDNEAL